MGNDDLKVVRAILSELGDYEEEDNTPGVGSPATYYCGGEESELAHLIEEKALAILQSHTALAELRARREEWKKFERLNNNPKTDRWAWPNTVIEKNIADLTNQIAKMEESK